MRTTSAAGSWILTSLGKEVSGNYSCGLAYFGGPAIYHGGLSEKRFKSNAQIGLAIFLRQSINRCPGSSRMWRSVRKVTVRLVKQLNSSRRCRPRYLGICRKLRLATCQTGNTCRVPLSHGCFADCAGSEHKGRASSLTVLIS